MGRILSNMNDPLSPLKVRQQKAIQYHHGYRIWTTKALPTNFYNTHGGLQKHDLYRKAPFCK